MEQLSRSHPSVFQQFPGEVRRGYLESAVAQAIQQGSWTVVADFLQAENLGSLYDAQKAKEIAQTTMESLIGHILDKHEAAGSEGMVEAAAAELTEALSAVSQIGVLECIREPMTAVHLVASISDANELLDTQRALTDVASGIDRPILRAAHHGIGDRLQKRCTDWVAQLTAKSDAAEALRSSERFFKEISQEEVLILYLEGSDVSAPESAAKFKQVMSDANESSNRLAEALKVAGAAGNKGALDQFQTFLQIVGGHAIQGYMEHLDKIIPTFSDECTVDISASTLQTSLSSHTRIMTMFAGEGVQKLLNQLNAAAVNELDPETTDLLTKSNTLQKLAPRQLGKVS